MFLFCLISGSVPLKRIKYNSKLEHEYITNFKILKASFKKMNVDQVSIGGTRKLSDFEILNVNKKIRFFSNHVC